MLHKYYGLGALLFGAVALIVIEIVDSLAPAYSGLAVLLFVLIALPVVFIGFFDLTKKRK